MTSSHHHQLLFFFQTYFRITLYKILDPGIFYKNYFVKKIIFVFFFKYSKHPKITCRLFALTDLFFVNYM
jgi:hypothetical protein